MSILLNTAITCTWIIIVAMTTIVDFSNVLKMIITFCTCLTVIVNYKSVKIFCVLLWLIIFSQWKFPFFSSPGQRWTFLIMNLLSLCIFIVVLLAFHILIFTLWNHSAILNIWFECSLFDTLHVCVLVFPVMIVCEGETCIAFFATMALTMSSLCD